MSDGLQDLLGEAGRLRAEISFILGRLSDLESLTRQVPHLHESEHGEISSTNYQYARSARENLQHAGADIENWRNRVAELLMSYQLSR